MITPSTNAKSSKKSTRPKESALSKTIKDQERARCSSEQSSIYEETNSKTILTRHPNFKRDAVLPLCEWVTEHMELPYPEKSDFLILAARSGLSPEQVRVWFMNVRRVIKFARSF